MSEMRTVLEVIGSITSNRESGRLEINSSGMYGTLLFSEGKLVDARLESLSGFQAVNAAVALRDVQFSFDHVPPAAHSSSITPSERVVLKRFFGIEVAEMEAHSDRAEPDPDWNAAPEQVVPLAEVVAPAGVEEIPQSRFEETPTVEVARVPVGNGVPVANAGSSFPWSRIAVSLVLLLALTAGAIALLSQMKARQQPAPVATIVSSEPPRDETNERTENVRDLNGEWRVINIVEKTAYKTFDNMQVGFRLVINQQGKEFTAKGEKFSENGQTLPAVSRTPIRVTGSIDGDKVVATFVEDGRARRTNGRFIWKLQDGGDELAGTFSSSAAKSSGRSAVTKQH